MFSFSHICLILTSTSNLRLTHVKTAIKCHLEGADLGTELGPRDPSAHSFKDTTAVPMPVLPDSELGPKLWNHP